MTLYMGTYACWCPTRTYLEWGRLHDPDPEENIFRLQYIEYQKSLIKAFKELHLQDTILYYKIGTDSRFFFSDRDLMFVKLSKYNNDDDNSDAFLFYEQSPRSYLGIDDLDLIEYTDHLK